MARPVVFISYTHDSDQHRATVLGLAERLRADGFDARIDQYVNGTPKKGWPRWMLDQLDAAGFVLVVCTETYYRRFRGHEEGDGGKGADWEGTLITQALYDSKSATTKFVPVMMSSGQHDFIPEPLRGQNYYELTSRARYQALHDRLLEQAGVEPGELGKLKRKPRRRGTPLSFDSASPESPVPSPVDSPVDPPSDRRDSTEAQDSSSETESAAVEDTLPPIPRCRSGFELLKSWGTPDSVFGVLISLLVALTLAPYFAGQEVGSLNLPILAPAVSWLLKLATPILWLLLFVPLLGRSGRCLARALGSTFTLAGVIVAANFLFSAPPPDCCFLEIESITHERDPQETTLRKEVDSLKEIMDASCISSGLHLTVSDQLKPDLSDRLTIDPLDDPFPIHRIYEHPRNGCQLLCEVADAFNSSSPTRIHAYASCSRIILQLADEPPPAGEYRLCTYTESSSAEEVQPCSS